MCPLGLPPHPTPYIAIAFFSRNPKQRAPPSHALLVRAERLIRITQKISLDASFKWSELMGGSFALSAWSKALQSKKAT